MEKKNMVLLTVIAVATLLVAVVGATFAYFTASTTVSGSAESSVTTNKLNGADITFVQDSKLELLNYPGGLAVYGAKATIKKHQAEGDNNEYQAKFNLKITYTNKTKTDLTWDLYMVESQYDDLQAAETTICKLQQKQNETDEEQKNEVQFWYADQNDPGTENNTNCSGSAITEKLNSLSAKKIASGKLIHDKESAEITKDTNGDNGEYTKGEDAELADRVINTENKPNKYYYLVVKYPNNGEDQSADVGQTISVTLSIDGAAESTLYNSTD